ncbi:MAG TPA: hypothetical protein VI756_00160, partial [Blastocatellia bacterium]
MTLASTFEPFDTEDVFCDRDEWDALFRDDLKNNPDAADRLVRLLYEILRSLCEGGGGSQRTINTLKLGILVLY